MSFNGRILRKVIREDAAKLQFVLVCEKLGIEDCEVSI